MTSGRFKCGWIHCNYASDKKWNTERHIERVHLKIRISNIPEAKAPHPLAWMHSQKAEAISTHNTTAESVAINPLPNIATSLPPNTAINHPVFENTLPPIVHNETSISPNEDHGACLDLPSHTTPPLVCGNVIPETSNDDNVSALFDNDIMDSMADFDAELPISSSIPILHDRPAEALDDGICISSIEYDGNSTLPFRQKETAESRELRRLHDESRSDEQDKRSSRKRKWLGSSFSKDLIPDYPVKRSKKYHNQQRAISWLTTEGKNAFDEKRADILGQWGLSPSHTGACLLLPSAWNNIDPLDLMEKLRRDNYPLRDAPRLVYRYDDHCTPFCRAAGWFSDWPRRGIELDNFLSCGPHSSMDGSHLCHQDNCLIHLVYEPSHINLDRKECRKHAQFLRGERREIPPYCDNENHIPRCLLQHAALTTLECYLIQGSILRQAKGLPEVQYIQPSQRHRFQTFENQLPLAFCPDSIITSHTVKMAAATPSDSSSESPSEVASQTSQASPVLRCTFCREIYKTVAGIWSHIRREHEDEATRLQEIRRTASLWRDYLEGKGDRKKSRPTYLKLSQIFEDDFNWEMVLSWKLSY